MNILIHSNNLIINLLFGFILASIISIVSYRLKLLTISDILSFKEITQGLSGGISIPGTLAAFAGAFVIAATSLPWIESNYKINIIIITIAGFIGSLVDSILGSLLQAQYKCKVCNSITERKFHCDKKTDLFKGKTWINNDVVNFGTGISGGIFSIILYDLFKG